MVKLTKAELARRKIRDSDSLEDGTRLGELFEKWGPDAWLNREYGYYDDPDYWTINLDREETDEEYSARIEMLKNQKAAYAASLREARKKRDADDRKTYERLKKKFEKN